MAIPKMVHYCWFGGKEKPEDVKKCIESWKQFLPDYQLMGFRLVRQQHDPESFLGFFGQ